MGKKVTIKNDDELQPTDILGTDLVVSMGGDHTFLHASALIWDKRIPILGINTYPTMFQGALNMHSIEHKERKEMSEKILTVMEDDLDVQFEKRSRILFERIRQNDQ
jgi:NAD kinase